MQLSLYLSIHLSVHVMYPSILPSTYSSICPFILLSVSLPVCQSVSLSICQAVRLSGCQAVRLSGCQSVSCLLIVWEPKPPGPKAFPGLPPGSLRYSLARSRWFESSRCPTRDRQVLQSRTQTLAKVFAPTCRTAQQKDKGMQDSRVLPRPNGCGALDCPAGSILSRRPNSAISPGGRGGCFLATPATPCGLFNTSSREHQCAFAATVLTCTRALHDKSCSHAHKH